MNKDLNAVINAIRIASSNIIAAIDNIGVDITKVVSIKNVVEYAHKESTIIRTHIDNIVCKRLVSTIETEDELNSDFIRSIEYIKYATRNYDAFILCCNYNALSPIKLIREFANDLRENPVLFSEIQTIANEL